MPKGSGLVLSAAPVVANGPEKRRIDELAALVDHCKAAQVIADAQGDRFLSYMLAMTIQAAQAAMRTRC